MNTSNQSLWKLVIHSIVFTALYQPLISQNHWLAYTDPDELFSIQVPYGIKEMQKRILTGIDTVDVYTYASLRPQEIATDSIPINLVLINIADYPEGTFPEDSITLIESFLQASMESLSINLKAHLDYQVPITSPVNGVKCRLTLHDKSDVVKCILFIYEDRFYTLQVFSPTLQSLHPDIDRILDSFSLAQ